MARWGMTIDLDLCTACQSCVVACKVENNIPPTDAGDAERGRSISWIRLSPQEDHGHEGESWHQLVPVPCMHCGNPPCVKVCPVQATKGDVEGLVAQIYPRCIGCRYCTTACPYTVRAFNWRTHEWPAPMERSLSPDVSIRPKGVVEKCTFCHHRIRRAEHAAAMEGRRLADDELQRLPACAAACPAGAIVFGDLSDPEAEVARQARSPRRFRLLDHLGTDPSVIYLNRDRR